MQTKMQKNSHKKTHVKMSTRKARTECVSVACLVVFDDLFVDSFAVIIFQIFPAGFLFICFHFILQISCLKSQQIGHDNGMT